MLQLLKDDLKPGRTIIDVPHEADVKGFKGVRCPQCHWHPSPSSRWSCHSEGTPEPRFPSCGAVWNTFATGGRCPGCGHQWKWTSCLQCHQWSLHEDWYDESDEDA